MTKEQFEKIQDYLLLVLDSLKPELDDTRITEVATKIACAYASSDGDRSRYLLEALKSLDHAISTINYNRGLQDGLANGIKILSKTNRIDSLRAS
jgi:hypothetical protein